MDKVVRYACSEFSKNFLEELKPAAIDTFDYCINNSTIDNYWLNSYLVALSSLQERGENVFVTKLVLPPAIRRKDLLRLLSYTPNLRQLTISPRTLGDLSRFPITTLLPPSNNLTSLVLKDIEDLSSFLDGYSDIQAAKIHKLVLKGYFTVSELEQITRKYVNLEYLEVDQVFLHLPRSALREINLGNNSLRTLKLNIELSSYFFGSCEHVLNLTHYQYLSELTLKVDNIARSSCSVKITGYCDRYNFYKNILTIIGQQKFAAKHRVYNDYNLEGRGLVWCKTPAKHRAYKVLIALFNTDERNSPWLLGYSIINLLCGVTYLYLGSGFVGGVLIFLGCCGCIMYMFERLLPPILNYALTS